MRRNAARRCGRTRGLRLQRDEHSEGSIWCPCPESNRAGKRVPTLRSPFGRTLLAIRENERRARFLGIPIERHIWLSFSISCFFTALAGSLYALLNNFADPMALHYSLSGEIVIMTVMGGMRVFWGPLLGAAVFVVLQDYISSMTVNWMSFIGLIFFLVVLFFPRGLLGMLQRRGAA